MRFENLSELWSMHGHGAFVWSAYAIAFVVLIAIVWTPLARQKRFFTQQQQIERRRQQASTNKIN